MIETNYFMFEQNSKRSVIYASTNEINEVSIMEAIQACGGVEGYHWNSEKHLILINKGFVVATLHSISQSKLAIISLFSLNNDIN
jgi:hypothetical protein